MPTALVTGATGSTGSALAAGLVRDGYDVMVFVRRSSNVHALESLGVEIRRVNLTDALPPAGPGRSAASGGVRLRAHPPRRAVGQPTWRRTTAGTPTDSSS